MLKSLFKKKQPPIVGLDIGTRCIKAVVLEGAEGDYMLTAFACEPIIKEAFREREITEIRESQSPHHWELMQKVQ